MRVFFTLLFLSFACFAQSAPSPADWADQVHQACAAEEARFANSIVRLEQRFQQKSRSKEEAAFVAQERKASAAYSRQESDIRIARLDFLLFGNRQRTFRRASREEFPGQALPHSFARMLHEAVPNASSCFLEHFAAAMVLGSFGLSPASPNGQDWLNIPTAYLQIRSRYRTAFSEGQTLDQAFRALTPASPTESFRYSKALLNRFQREASSSQPRWIPVVERFALLAAPTLRIQTYLGLRVQAEEQRTSLLFRDKAIETLRARVRENLFGDRKKLAQLQSATADNVLQQIQPVFDAWAQTQVASSRQKLTQDPHGELWSFVESGHRAASPTSSSQAQYAELERQLATVAIPKARFLEAARSRLSAPDLAQLEKLCGNCTDFSALTLYQGLLADVTRFRGSISPRLLRAGAQIIADAKRQFLRDYLVSPALASVSAPQREFLRGAGERLIAFEEKQAIQDELRVSTGGGAVGWLLRHLVIGGSVPPALWAPGGPAGEAFAALIDASAGQNSQSQTAYRARPASTIRYVASGQPYHDEVAAIIGNARDFVNVQAFDWKVDIGGKEMAYRLMAKKLGIDAGSFDRMVESFSEGLALDQAGAQRTRFYDLPSKEIRHVLVFWALRHSPLASLQSVRARLEAALGAPLSCPALRHCGDLQALRAITGDRYLAERAQQPRYQQAWEAFQALESLTTSTPVALARTKPQNSVSDYIRSNQALRTLVQNHGLRRASNPQLPFSINIIADGKQNLNNIHWFRFSRSFPFLYSDPANDLYLPLIDFGVEMLQWKGLFEFPWHVGPLPIPGRKLGGVFPIPYVPYPWLKSVPGFHWANLGASFFLQHALATDIRTWWAMSMHSKNISNESVAMQSGMGLASKYMNFYPELPTWHDAAVVAEGPVVGDANDQFVASFNRARVNNGGLARSRGAQAPKLRYEDYAYRSAAAPQTGRSWLLTTDPDGHDYNYRTVFMAALAAAQKNIYIENVFYSDPLITKMLLKKAREFRARVDCSGLSDAACALKRNAAVDIHLIVPDHSDKTAVDAVGFAQFFDMVQAGVKIYRWNPRAGWSKQRMVHTKAWLVDYVPGQEALTYVGSHNANQRSHFADNEVGIVSTNRDFARQTYEELFQVDIRRDSRLESRDFFEVERFTTKGARFGNWLAKIFVDYSWFF